MTPGGFSHPSLPSSSPSWSMLTHSTAAGPACHLPSCPSPHGRLLEPPSMVHTACHPRGVSRISHWSCLPGSGQMEDRRNYHAPSQIPAGAPTRALIGAPAGAPAVLPLAPPSTPAVTMRKRPLAAASHLSMETSSPWAVMTAWQIMGAVWMCSSTRTAPSSASTAARKRRRQQEAMTAQGPPPPSILLWL